jgi:integrase
MVPSVVPDGSHLKKKNMAKSKGKRDSGSGTITKDGDGYRVKVFVGHDPATGNRRYKSARAKTHAEAVEMLGKLQAKHPKGSYNPAKLPTLSEYAHAWLEKVKAFKTPATYRQYEWVLRTHVLPTLGGKRLDKITRPDVKALATALSKQKRKPKTPGGAPGPTLSRRAVESAVAVLRTVMNDALQDGAISENPVRKIELPRAARKEAQWLGPADVPKLVAALEGNPARELIVFLLATGTRLGEATGLRWSDVDLENRAVKVCGQLQRVNGKLVRLDHTKTNQDRLLGIPPFFADELRGMAVNQDLLGIRDPEGIVFLNAEGRRWDQKNVNNHLKAACRKAGLPELSAHKLRHSFASLALAETGDIHAVRKTLGHQQSRLTTDLYGHVTAETLRPVMGAVWRVMESAQD